MRLSIASLSIAAVLCAATGAQAACYTVLGPNGQILSESPNPPVDMSLPLHQSVPEQVARQLRDDAADIGIATESLAEHEGIVSLPCYDWQHVMVVPAAHALAAVERPTLEQIAGQTLVLYHPTVAGRTRIDAAFARARLAPQVALEAIDSDIIKTYVRLGLGVGIVTELAMRDEPPDSGLVARPLGHLFGSNVTRVAFKRGAYLRHFVHAFTELLSPRLTPALVARAMSGQGSDYGI
jgi:LysR family cys regulon transcriptional activator